MVAGLRLFRRSFAGWNAFNQKIVEKTNSATSLPGNFLKGSVLYTPQHCSLTVLFVRSISLTCSFSEHMFGSMSFSASECLRDSKAPSIMIILTMNPLFLYTFLTFRRPLRRTLSCSDLTSSPEVKRMCRECVNKNFTPFTDITSS